MMENREQQLEAALRSVFNEANALLDDPLFVEDRNAVGFMMLNSALEEAERVMPSLRGRRGFRPLSPQSGE